MDELIDQASLTGDPEFQGYIITIAIKLVMPSIKYG
jgi:hypothetical protein